MMGKNAYHSDRVAGPWHPHLMFFLPRMEVAEWGANVPGSPVMGAGGATEPWTLDVVELHVSVLLACVVGPTELPMHTRQ